MGTRVEFEGTCHTRAEDDGYDGTYFTKGDMEGKLKSLPGTPVWNEHDKAKIGEIIGARIDDTNSLVVKGYIDRGSWKGIQAVHDVRGGKVKGLSLGMDFKYEGDAERMIEKSISEISITKNPDLPDAKIHNIQGDSDNWKLGRKIVQQGIAHENLKNECYKSRMGLLGLIGKLQAADLSSNNSSHRKNMTSESTTPETASPPAKTETNAEKPNDLTALQEELAKTKQDMKVLETEKTQYAELYNNIQQDPQKWQQVMMDKKKEEEEESHKMLEDSKMVVDYFTDVFIKQGKKAPQILLDVAKHGHKNPAEYKPVYELATVARANMLESQSKAEKKYQELKKTTEFEKEALKKQYDNEIGKREKEMEIVQDQWHKENKAAGYKQQLAQSNLTKRTAPSENLPAKKNKEEKEEDPSFAKHWNIPQPTVPPGILGIRRGGGLQRSDDEAHTGFLAQILIGGSHIPEGMNTMDIPGIAGKFYHPAKAGVLSDTGKYPAMDETLTIKSGAAPDLIKD